MEEISEPAMEPPPSIWGGRILKIVSRETIFLTTGRAGAKDAQRSERPITCLALCSRTWMATIINLKRSSFVCPW